MTEETIARLEVLAETFLGFLIGSWNIVFLTYRGSQAWRYERARSQRDDVRDDNAIVRRVKGSRMVFVVMDKETVA